jgi:hypothetical protein
MGFSGVSMSDGVSLRTILLMQAFKKGREAS